MGWELIESYIARKELLRSAAPGYSGPTRYDGIDAEDTLGTVSRPSSGFGLHEADM
jgi:hypothetical protein